MRLQDLRDHVVQPGSPLVQRALLLQGDLKVLLQTLHHALVTLAHPRRLLLLRPREHIQQDIPTRPLCSFYPPSLEVYLDVGEVHPVEVGEHLVDLRGILEDSAGCLGQVVQTGVTSQCLGEGADYCHLHHGDGTRETMKWNATMFVGLFLFFNHTDRVIKYNAAEEVPEPGIYVSILHRVPLTSRARASHVTLVRIIS